MSKSMRATLSLVWQMTLMALRYLSARKLRTTLTTLAIVIGVALIFAINLILPAAISMLRGTMLAASGTVDLTVVSATGESFAPETLEKVAGVADVSAVSGVLRRLILLPDVGKTGSIGSAAQIELIGLDPQTAQDVRPYAMSEGRFLQPGDANKALLPAGVADLAPEIGLNTMLPLLTAGGLRLYNVVGLLAEPISPQAIPVYVSLADAQSALRQPGLINAIDIAITPGADRDAVGQAVLAAVGDGFELDTADDATSFSAAEIGYIMMYAMGLLALFIGGFLIFNTFRTVVVERRHDLAMLRAIGASRRQVTWLILVESLIQGVIGSVAGLIVGYLMAGTLNTLMTSAISVFMAGREMTIEVTPGAALGALAIGMITTLVAGYVPARNAAKVAPLEGLRPVADIAVRKAARRGLTIGLVVMAFGAIMLLGGGKTGAAGAVVFMVGMVAVAPALVMPVARLLSPLLSVWYAREGDLARGNLIRQPGRAAITASTLMIGLATLVLMGALVASFDTFIKDMVNRNFSSDIMLMPRTVATYRNVVGADPVLAEQIRALPEVEAVGALRYATSVINGKPLELMGIDPAEYPRVSNLDFVEGDPATAYAQLGEGRNVIVNSITAFGLSLQMGSEFSLPTPNGAQTYNVVGIANDLLSFKVNAMFLSQDNLAADFQKAEDIMILVKLRPGEDAQAVNARIEAIAADYPQFTPLVTGEYRQTLNDLIGVALQLFYGLGILILIPAVLGLVNTLAINVMERRREIGVVRAVGGSRKQVRRVVTAEALLLGLFGAAMGVVAGVAISYGFISAFSLIGWNVPYAFPVIGMIAAIVAGVIAALLAAILPARNAARLDIVRALQYE
ncbi:MAG: ABC transporter permease [Anaerolineae bacterium]|nr:ABC transporter permease [Anaerolineae bacterium]